MSPVIALTWTLTALVAVCAFSNMASLAFYALGLSLLLAVATSSVRGIRIAFLLTLPFVAPLGLIHGVLNPAFATTGRLWEIIPLRGAGLLFAAVISTRILILSLAVAAWREVDRDRLIADAVAFRVPLPLIVMVAVATSTICLLVLRMQKVHLAQQARGISAGPSLRARVCALPSMVIPVVTATIGEGDKRGLMMASRGLGTTRIALSSPQRSIAPKEICSMVLGTGWLVASWLM